MRHSETRIGLNDKRVETIFPPWMASRGEASTSIQADSILRCFFSAAAPRHPSNRLKMIFKAVRRTGERGLERDGSVADRSARHVSSSMRPGNREVVADRLVSKHSSARIRQSRLVVAVAARRRTSIRCVCEEEKQI